MPHHLHDVPFGALKAAERDAQQRAKLPLLAGGQDLSGPPKPRALVDGRLDSGRPQAPQALAASDSVEPGPETPERGQHFQARGRDHEGVRHRLGSIVSIADQRPAVGPKQVSVLVIRLCKSIRITINDGRGKLLVSHGHHCSGFDLYSSVTYKIALNCTHRRAAAARE